MYQAVTDEQVAAYMQLVESLARRYVNPAVMAERDDLIQEGLIAVWQSLEDGQSPSEEFIRMYMRQWVRKCWRLKRGDAVVGDSYIEEKARPVHTERD